MITASKPPKDWRRRLLRWSVEGAFLLLALYLIHLWQTWDTVKGTAPALSEATLSGERFSLDQERGRPLLVYFWASWCPVCGITSGNIDRLSQNHAVITVAMQSGSDAELRRHLETEALNFSAISDPDGRIANRWHVKGVPTLYILDKQNRIRSTTVGYTSSLGLRARLWLAEQSLQ
jgi:peroxiredoxin